MLIRATDMHRETNQATQSLRSRKPDGFGATGVNPEAPKLRKYKWQVRFFIKRSRGGRTRFIKLNQPQEQRTSIHKNHLHNSQMQPRINPFTKTFIDYPSLDLNGINSLDPLGRN